MKQVSSVRAVLEERDTVEGHGPQHSQQLGEECLGSEVGNLGTIPQPHIGSPPFAGPGGVKRVISLSLSSTYSLFPAWASLALLP